VQPFWATVCKTVLSRGTQVARRQIGGWRGDDTTRDQVGLVFRLLSVVGDLFDTLWTHKHVKEDRAARDFDTRLLTAYSQLTLRWDRVLTVAAWGQSACRRG